MRVLLTALLAAALPGTLAAQQEQQTIEFSGRTWAVFGEEVKAETHLGQEAVRLRNGALVLTDSEFENGTIEFDVASSGHRSFVGAAFRIAGGTGDYEDFYLRPHQTGRFDATQYTPVFHNISAWQLYPEHNATLDIPVDQWVHVKLVVSGTRLEAYCGSDAEPTLVVEHLKRGATHGVIALKAAFPAAGQLPDHYPTAFANFELHPDETAGTSAELPEPAPEYIGHWAISPTVAPPQGTLLDLPPELLEADGWSEVSSEPSGLVNLARFRAFPQGTTGGMVLARVLVRSERDQVKRLNFGFSDRGSIFLNGQVVFSGDNTYRSRSPRYLGVVTVENDAVFLPLRQGENELVVAVSESFGGWGLIARFEDLRGISVDPALP
jgi:hypothetical protein